MNYFIVLFKWSLLSIILQHEPVYRIKMSRAVIPRINKQYADGKVWISKPNRYTNAVNGEFILYNIPRDTKVKVKGYEFFHNEYRPFAINLERDLCSFLTLEYKMMLYPDLVKAGAHMPEPRCPVKPGNYSFANFRPDDANYPASLPFHNSMLEIGYWHGTLELGVPQFYGIWDRDAVIREQYS